jgi:hypothetical protein
VLGAAFMLAGAEPEEMTTAGIASGRHHPGLAAAVAYNATASLSVAALVRPWPSPASWRVPSPQGPCRSHLIAIAPNRRLSRWAGVLLIITYAGWVTAVLTR